MQAGLNNDDNILAAAALCSGLVKSGIKPLSFREWHRLIARLYESGIENPSELFDMKIGEICCIANMPGDMAARIFGLLRHKSEVAETVRQLEAEGISIIPMDSGFYPEALIHKLGGEIPPIFFCAGNRELINMPSVSVVGSRNVSESGKIFAQRVGAKIAADGYNLTSGGAVGCDTVAEYYATEAGGSAVLYLAVPLAERMKNRRMRALADEGRICLLSDYNPHGCFTAGGAIYRNRYIYCASDYTFVCESRSGAGGTYNGAVRCLECGYGKLYVYDNRECEGNRKLIEQGGVAISANDVL